MHYRLFILNDAGRVIRADIIEGESDAVALAAAIDCQCPTAVELWDEGRFIARIAGWGHVGQAAPVAFDRDLGAGGPYPDPPC